MHSPIVGSLVVIIGGRGSLPTRGGLEVAQAAQVRSKFPAAISPSVAKSC